ncbi:MAG: hypothetical protein KDC24_09545 [Saprospiraceae bacterium]|nr:hypothetical protein [Saprospiraceae bacterium]
MLKRSLGAGTFAGFWQYWNPIWSYYLGKYIFKPLKKVFPVALSLVLTFVVCGFIHDLVIMGIRKELALVFTPWFLLMGTWVVVSERFNLQYNFPNWVSRAVINLITIVICFWLAGPLML